MHFIQCCLVIFLIYYAKGSRGISCNCTASKFPSSFKFGAGTSAYQIEGGWNENGKSRSNWDFFMNTYPALNNNVTGNVACDSFHKWQEDVAAVKEIGLDFYRFSISWSRILPKGFSNKVNQDGVDYYNNLINALVEAGIEPMVTMYHWDTPMTMAYLGNEWTNPLIVDYFVNYADLLFSLFGDRVKLWSTINEPRSFCQGIPDYFANFFPEMPVGTLEYLCTHHVLLAHAKTYRLYQQKYKATQKGKISIVLDYNWNEPKSNSTEDLAAVERKNAFEIGWIAHPITYGDYPPLLKTIVASNSAYQNFTKSRLPEFSASEKMLLRGSYDFFGLNHYTSIHVTSGTYNRNVPHYVSDKNATETSLLGYPGSCLSGNNVVPWGLRKTLNYIKDNYGNPEIIVTENGFCDTTGVVNDTERVEFLKKYLEAVRLAACEDKVKVTSYTYWSLLDNLEWSRGFGIKFGIVQVDFSSKNLTRTIKNSGYYYRSVIKTRLLNSTDYLPN